MKERLLVIPNTISASSTMTPTFSHIKPMATCIGESQIISSLLWRRHQSSTAITMRRGQTSRRFTPRGHQQGACPNLDWGDALCSVEHKRTSSTITRLDQRKLNERTVLSPLQDLDRLRPSPTKSSGKRPIDELSEVNETTSGWSMCVLVGCPDGLTFRLAERAKTSQGTRVTATGPSYANYEDC